MTENEAYMQTVRKIAAKIDAALDAARGQPPQGRRVGARMRFEAYGDLATDQVRPDGSPRLATDNVVAPHYDLMDNELVRARFDLSGARRYSREEADALLQRRFPEDVVLRTACKLRLSALGLLTGDEGQAGRAPDVRALEARGSRPGDLRASADPEPRGHTGSIRTNSRGVLLGQDGRPLTLRSHPY